ncbi:hypothetical protein M9Y10_045945 [Tritrichomonas musculus]|uniref:Dedicator of cytokinesis family protein n=1 Tax=Tritrichomonas musculus TaxID=1915356 RepID=A0ABR2JWP2_9EUKA
MELIDEHISKDIKNISETKSIPWMKPIISIHPKETNPFLQDDLQELNEMQSVINSEVGHLYCIPGCEMEIEFPDEFEQITSSSSIPPAFRNTTDTLRSIARAVNKTSLAQAKEINKTYSTGYNKSHSFNSSHSKPLTKNVTVSLTNFSPNVVDVKMIEPILCSLFLYSGKEKKIISDYWNFIPPASIPLLDSANIHSQSCNTATFLIDPRIMNDNPYFILLLSHPLTVDNSSSISKYYVNPSPQAEQAAVKKLHSTFPTISNCYCTFACSFIQFTRVDFQMPMPYLLEGPLQEKEIHDFISDAAKKLKQIPFSIFFKSLESPGSNPLFIRPIYRIFVQPQLSPIHDLVVRIESFSMRLTQSHKMNIVISVSLTDENQNKFNCVRSKFMSMGFINEAFSRGFYHSKGPVFDDSFLIKLPQPVSPTTALQFKIYHAHLKKPEKGLTLVGTATVPLFKNKHGLFIENGEHSAHAIPEGSTKVDKTMKVTFSTFLRSNMVINDKKFLVFAMNKGKMLPILNTLSEQVVVFNLMYILDKILKSFAFEKDISFLPFIHIRDSSLKITESFKFNKYLNIFVRYFALKDLSPKRGVDAKENIDIDLTVNSNDTFNEIKPNQTPASTDFIAPIMKIPIRSNTASTMSRSGIHSARESPLSPPLSPLTSISASPLSPEDSSSMAVTEPIQTRKSARSFISLQGPTTSTGVIDKSLHNSSSWFDLNKISPVPNEVKSVGPTDPTNVSNISLIDFADINNKKNEQIPIHLKLISCFTRTIEANGLKYMNHLIDFIFSLIVKSFAMTSKIDCFAELDALIKMFAQSVRNDMANVKKHSKSIGLFSNLLFDIRLSIMATKVTRIYLSEFLSTPETYGVAVQYINYAFRPALFYFSLKYITDFKLSLIRIIEVSFKNEFLYGVFGVIIQILSCYDDEMSCDVASALLPCVGKVRPNQLSSTSEIVTHMLFLNFLIEHSSTKALADFCSTPENMQALFNMCHFLLMRVAPEELSFARRLLIQRIESSNDPVEEKVVPIKVAQRPRRETIKVKQTAPPKLTNDSLNTITVNKSYPIPPVEEILNAAIQSIFKFASKYVTIADMNGALKLLTLCFHMMNNKSIDDYNFNCIMDFLSILFGNFSPGIFQSTQPCIVRLIGRLFDFCIEKKNQTEISKPILALYHADLKTSNTSDIADAFCTRALALMKYDYYNNPLITGLMESLELSQATNNYSKKFFKMQNISKYINDPKISSELLQNYIITRFALLNDSPDSQFESLSDLFNLHSKSQNSYEMANVCILQAVLIMEVLTVNKRIPQYLNVEHPAKLLESDYPFLHYIEAPKVLNVPSFADSPSFNEYGILTLLYKAVNICSESKLYDRAMLIIDVIWPMLEERRLYDQIGSFFGNFQSIFSSAYNAPKVTNPFFKVSLFGTAFTKENGKSFIYRAKELTNLFEFADTIIKKYQAISPESTIELISDSDVVDVSKLDPAKNYIQVTFVEPYKPENGSTYSNQFFFDRPFVPGEKKKQGNIINQWIARTIVTTQFHLPSVIVRSIVIETITREFAPIVNAYRMIRKRTESMEAALIAKDTRQVQQLLHGSLIVTVNEGPEKIAEAFLGGPDSKEKQKLCFEFNKMLKVLRVGVKFHGDWVTNNNEFVPLQVQLEDGLIELTSKLDKIDHSLVK